MENTVLVRRVQPADQPRHLGKRRRLPNRAELTLNPDHRPPSRDAIQQVRSKPEQPVGQIGFLVDVRQQVRMHPARVSLRRQIEFDQFLLKMRRPQLREQRARIAQTVGQIVRRGVMAGDQAPKPAARHQGQ